MARIIKVNGHATLNDLYGPTIALIRSESVGM
jgi:hypothetical protein